MHCPSSDAGVKSELDVEALVSYPSYGNKLSRMVVSIYYIRHPGQPDARDLVNASILRT